MYVHQILLDTSSSASGVTNDKSGTGCLNSWFEFDGAPFTVDHTLAPGADYDVSSGDNIGTLWLKDDGNEPADQDPCQGALATVHFTSN